MVTYFYQLIFDTFTFAQEFTGNKYNVFATRTINPGKSLYSSGNAMTITFTSNYYYNYYRGFLIAVEAGTYHMKAFECKSRKELSVNCNGDNSELSKLNFEII